MTPDIAREALETGLFDALTWKRALVAGGVLLAFLLLAKLAGHGVRRALPGEARRAGGLHSLSKLLTYFLVFLGVVTALGLLGLPLSSLLHT